MQVAWVRCFDGGLLNLDRADRVDIEQGKTKDHFSVVARSEGFYRTIVLNVPHTVAVAVMKRIVGKTVGFGETALDFHYVH